MAIIPVGLGAGGGADTSVVTAIATDVLSGKVIVDREGEIVVGLMPNNAAVDRTLRASEEISIPAGYTPGGKVKAESLAPQTPGTAVAADILAGKTAVVNGATITGTLTIQSIVNFKMAVAATAALKGTWSNPIRGPYSGVHIRVKTGAYPTSRNDGTLVYEGAANTFTASDLGIGTTHYFRAWPYIDTNLGRIFGTEHVDAAGIPVTVQGAQNFTGTASFVVPAGVTLLECFLVGGGGAGGTSNGACGGNGGFTKYGRVAVTPGEALQMVVGAGGIHSVSTNAKGGDGQQSSILRSGTNLIYANGGIGGLGSRGSESGNGSGGSGGACAAMGYASSSISPDYGRGGSDGSSGDDGYDSRYPGGKGQGTSTRCPWDNTLYAGGGGGGGFSSRAPFYGPGGAGGGGRGGDKNTENSPGQAGAPNTGGGGGGGANKYGSIYGGDGGSGIIRVRWGY